MKSLLVLLGGALLLAGCNTTSQQPGSSNNPVEQQCRAEGAVDGDALKTCMRRKGTLGVGRATCERKGLKAGTQQFSTCVKLEADFTEATIRCQSMGRSSHDMEAFKACIRSEAPEAANYAMPAGI